jgi:hypothetical protein
MSDPDSGPPSDGLREVLTSTSQPPSGSLLWQFTSRSISQTMDFTTGTDLKSR